MLNEDFQVSLIGGAMKAFVKTTGIKTGELFLYGFNHRHSDFVIGGFLADLAMQNKAMAIFRDADPQAQFNRDTGFAFANPFGVGLEQGKDFFVMGNGFALNGATSNLIDLTFGMQAKGAQVCEQHFRYLKVVF